MRRAFAMESNVATMQRAENPSSPSPKLEESGALSAPIDATLTQMLWLFRNDISMVLF